MASHLPACHIVSPGFCTTSYWYWAPTKVLHDAACYQAGQHNTCVGACPLSDHKQGWFSSQVLQPTCFSSQVGTLSRIQILQPSVLLERFFLPISNFSAPQSRVKPFTVRYSQVQCWNDSSCPNRTVLYFHAFQRNIKYVPKKVSKKVSQKSVIKSVPKSVKIFSQKVSHKSVPKQRSWWKKLVNAEYWSLRLLDISPHRAWISLGASGLM